jgi:hypothetical protein
MLPLMLIVLGPGGPDGIVALRLCVPAERGPDWELFSICADRFCHGWNEA